MQTRKSRTVRILAWVFLWLVAGHALQAEEIGSPGSEETLEPSDETLQRELMEILEESTEIATKTRMNADYVPGIVSILHGDDLEALGVQTVWEALSLLPGVQTVRAELGNPVVSVRGLNFRHLSNAS